MLPFTLPTFAFPLFQVHTSFSIIFSYPPLSPLAPFFTIRDSVFALCSAFNRYCSDRPTVLIQVPKGMGNIPGLEFLGALCGY